MDTVPTWQLRARFAACLSELYGREVPAYNTLVDVSRMINEGVISAKAVDAERFGSISRVTAERHGAIRVGTAEELRQVSRIFAALGMYPTGYYDLRDAKPTPVPVVSTAFRPLNRDQLALNPFRVFTSLLVCDDRRFFDTATESQLKEFLDNRTLFPEEILHYAEKAIEHQGLSEKDTEHFLVLAARAFALSDDPVDYEWYQKLESISSVAADIGGVSTTHINHLTPRVLDIDGLYSAMGAHGIEMIDDIQGPPRWDGPNVLLRQTSFRALAEPRPFRGPDGQVFEGSLRVRFGEVEARGMALTPSGRDLYDDLMVRVDRELSTDPTGSRQDIATKIWNESMPTTERGFLERNLAFFTFRILGERHPEKLQPDAPAISVLDLIDQGILAADPIVYEDFLPRSAAGIFSSNLTGDGSIDEGLEAAARGIDWLSDALGVPINLPESVYAFERQESITNVSNVLGVRLVLPGSGDN